MKGTLRVKLHLPAAAQHGVAVLHAQLRDIQLHPPFQQFGGKIPLRVVQGEADFLLFRCGVQRHLALQTQGRGATIQNRRIKIMHLHARIRLPPLPVCFAAQQAAAQQSQLQRAQLPFPRVAHAQLRTRPGERHAVRIKRRRARIGKLKTALHRAVFGAGQIEAAAQFGGGGGSQPAAQIKIAKRDVRVAQRHRRG